MCGITGIVNFKNYVRKDRENFVQLTESIELNGTTNVWFSTFVGFGIKSFSSEQRIYQTKSNGNMYSIVFGGSLSNVEAINHILVEKGHSIPSSSDAETVLHAFVEWGEKCLEILDGSFIFAIWDDAKQQLTLVRSPVAVESIYYIYDSMYFLFGTEIDPILNYDEDSSKNVKELLKGQTLLFADGQIKQSSGR